MYTLHTLQTAHDPSASSDEGRMLEALASFAVIFRQDTLLSSSKPTVWKAIQV